MQARKRKGNKTRNILACFLFASAFAWSFMPFKGGELRIAEALPSRATESPSESFDKTEGVSAARADITVVTPSKSYRYRDDLLPCPDHLVYEQMERRKINADLPEKMQTVEKCLSAGASLPDAFAYTFPHLPAFIAGIKKEADVPALSSEIRFDPGKRPMFSITREKYGNEIDERRLYQDIFLALRRSATVSVSASPVVVRPQVTIEENIACTKKIASYRTSFASSGEGRKNNIRLALKKVSGAVVLPGESFSFNERVGARSEENGFMPAKIIVGGEYTEGIGGGVCQVSTTLYNAALLAGMRVTAVRGHTIQPSYVPPSLDAMVNASTSDLCFVNPFDTPVFIAAETEGESVAAVTFYGHVLPYTIKAVSRELSHASLPADREEIDEERKYVGDAPAGTRVRVSYSHAKVTSESYLRYFTPSGQFIKEEKIRTDTYAETKGLIAVAP